LRLRKVPAAAIRTRALAALHDIGLDGMAERYPHQLSGGQQQRVALARAIVYDPELLLLDEPLSNLDAKLREEARVWLRELIERLHISAVCVTHDQVEALAIADRVLLLDRGKIEQEGTPQEMYGEPATLFSAEFMGSNNRIPGTLAEISGDQGRLAGEGWELWGRLRGAPRAGGSAIGVIRLERTEVREAPAENSLQATLETSVYLGERWDSLFRVGSLRLRTWTPEPPAKAAHWLHFPREWLWIFPA
jgi:iron(III) transport system ATP-binding protein